MKTKKLNLLFAGIFALVFLMTFASAALSLSGFPTELPQTPLTGSFNFEITSNLDTTVSFSMPDIIVGGEIIHFTVPLSTPLTTGVPQTLSVSYDIATDFDFEFGEEYIATLTATDLSSSTATQTLTFEDSDFCEYDNKGDLKVTIKGIDVVGDNDFGKDDEWFAFDNIEVEIRVENDGNEDLKDVVVEWGLYNTQTKEWTIELTEENDFNLDSDEREDIVLSFRLDNSLDEDLEDMEDGKYILYIKATGEIDGGVDDGENTCASDSEEVSLIVEDDFVIISEFEVSGEVQCNSEIQILAEVWNIGSDDQEEVYIRVYNKELGINEDIELGDLDTFDSSDIIYALNIPKDAEEKTYNVQFTVYDEDDDVYENSNDDKAIFTVELRVSGGCSVAGASVDAILESGGKAGRDLVVRATVTNTGNSLASYTINVNGFSDWASKVNLDKTTLVIGAGESGEILLTFDVNKDAEGIKLFNLEIVSDSMVITSQPVQVEITKGSFSLGNLFSGNNKAIWGIGLLNLILVVLIIVIAVRVSRKK